MVEKSKSEVLRDLYAIKYMDLFLEDSGQPGEYHRMLRTLERFRDIGRTMIRVEEDTAEADRIIQVLFSAGTFSPAPSRHSRDPQDVALTGLASMNWLAKWARWEEGGTQKIHLWTPRI